MGSEFPRIILNWPRRLQIAIGASQGLSYTLHDCSPTIVQCYIGFECKIADFGLAKILMKKGNPETASTLAGTFGYIAPEYSYTSKINEKSDIYNFGVVLLELAMGRKPILPEEISLGRMGMAEVMEGYETTHIINHSM